MEIDCVNRYFDAWNARDADAILASLSVQGTYQDPTTEGPISGEAIRGYVGALWSAFPDLNFETKNVGEVAPGRFAGQWTMRGTNTGSMRGLPPSNRTVEVEGADFFEIDGDRVGKVEGYFDAGAVPRQIGLNVSARPYAIGPFRFGDSTCVQTGKTDVPGAFSVTYLEAADEEAAQTVRDLSRDALDRHAEDGRLHRRNHLFGRESDGDGVRLGHTRRFAKGDVGRRPLLGDEAVLFGLGLEGRVHQRLDRASDQSVLHALRQLPQDAHRT